MGLVGFDEGCCLLARVRKVQKREKISRRAQERKASTSALDCPSYEGLVTTIKIRGEIAALIIESRTGRECQSFFDLLKTWSVTANSDGEDALRSIPV